MYRCTSLFLFRTADAGCVNAHDNETQCALWAMEGECVSAAQADFMNSQCARYCSHCDRGRCDNVGVLSDVKCDYWASRGECERNRDFMSTNCRRSCQRCVDVPGALAMTSCRL